MGQQRSLEVHAAMGQLSVNPVSTPTQVFMPHYHQAGVQLANKESYQATKKPATTCSHSASRARMGKEELRPPKLQFATVKTLLQHD